MKIYYGSIICKRKKKVKKINKTLSIFTLCSDKYQNDLYEDYNHLLYNRQIIKLIR